MEKGKTRLGNSYWNNTGYYQDIYDRLYDNHRYLDNIQISMIGYMTI